MFFSELLVNISQDRSIKNLLQHIITPFTPYYLCKHYIGNEAKMNNIPIPSGLNDLLQSNNMSLICDYDIIYVEVNYFSKFINDYLPKLTKKIILMTGQWHKPQIINTKETDDILANPQILLWVSQNPIYMNNPKYMAITYGIRHDNLTIFSNAILKNKNISKTIDIVNLPIANYTNPCRSKLPVLKPISAESFYETIAISKFVISPIGDRDDCYRHCECIGLGAVPVSNVGILYRELFTDSMLYYDIDTIADIARTNKINESYHVPNKDLICLNYYRDAIMQRVFLLKNII